MRTTLVIILSPGLEQLAGLGDGVEPEIDQLSSELSAIIGVLLWGTTLPDHAIQHRNHMLTVQTLAHLDGEGFAAVDIDYTQRSELLPIGLTITECGLTSHDAVNRRTMPSSRPSTVRYGMNVLTCTIAKKAWRCAAIDRGAARRR